MKVDLYLQKDILCSKSTSVLEIQIVIKLELWTA